MVQLSYATVDWFGLSATVVRGWCWRRIRTFCVDVSSVQLTSHVSALLGCTFQPSCDAPGVGFVGFRTSCSFRARAIMLTMLCCVIWSRRRRVEKCLALHLRIAEDFAASGNAHVTNALAHIQHADQDFSKTRNQSISIVQIYIILTKSNAITPILFSL